MQEQTDSKRAANELRVAEAMAEHSSTRFLESIEAIAKRLEEKAEDIRRYKSWDDPALAATSVINTLLWMVPNLHADALFTEAQAVIRDRQALEAAEAAALAAAREEEA